MVGSRPTQAGRISLGAFAGRLLIIGLIFGGSIVVQLQGDAVYSERELNALWALVALGFGLTAIYGLLGTRSKASWLPWLELAGDGLLITALVYCTGGSRSVLAFLYVVWIVHAAVRSGPAAAVAISVLATTAFGSQVLGSLHGWVPPFEPGNVPSVNEALSSIGRHTLAFVAVAAWAHHLAREIEVGKGELQELGQIYQRIVDNVSSGLLTIDRAGLITSFNREAERITGYGAEEVIGRALKRLFSDERLAGDGPELSSQVTRGELRFKNREGHALHLGFSSSVLQDEAGLPEGRVLIFQDLTRVVEMEEQLRLSERLSAVGQLAAGMAHEIRNPLASLSGAIELLEGDLPRHDDNSRRLIRIVRRETERLNRLVSDFLTYAKPGPGKRERIALGELLAELAELLETQTEVEPHLDVPAGLQVVGDPDQLRQVLWNLMLNAVQAEPEDQRIRIVAQIEPASEANSAPWVSIAIADRGAGIPVEHLEHIFEPFFTTKPKGTGLGLATVHRIIEGLEGQLQVDSQVGEGTTVEVRLPAPRKAG